MNPSEKVINDFESIAREFYEILASFTQEQFNEIPFEECWTVGQVGRHVYKAIVKMPATLQAPGTKAERTPDELVEPINKIFLDFTIKLKSPDFIIPEDKEYNREETLADFREKIKEIVDTSRPLDLAITTPFQLPTIGYLTRMELIYFAGVHTQRHTRQLKKIKGHFSTTAS